MCTFITTPAGYHVPVIHTKPQKGDVRYRLCVAPDGHEYVYTRTFNGSIWI
jgi:hypothetical protein